MAKKYSFDFSGTTEGIKKSREKKSYEKDARFFTITKDKEKEALVVVRFLMSKDSQPYVQYYDHNFKYTESGATKYWIENCINTFGYDKKCPICEKNMILYKSPHKMDNAMARVYGRKLHYISNILILQDENCPENVGKVFLFKYGKKIHDKIMRHWIPTDKDLKDTDFKQFIPFDLYEGANFKIKVKEVVTGEESYPNYDDSSFSAVTALYNGDDNKIGEVMNKVYDLSEFIDPAKYPSNEKTTKALGLLLSLSSTESSTVETQKEEETTGFTFEPEAEPEKEVVKEKTPPPAEPVEAVKEVTKEPETPKETPSEADAELDATLAFFQSIKT